MATRVRNWPVGTRVTVGGNESTVEGYEIKGDEATRYRVKRVDNGAESVVAEDAMTRVVVAAAARRPLEASNLPTNL